MTFDVDTLYALMPAIYRIRDQQLAGYSATGDPLDGPLKALLRVIAGQAGLVEDSLSQLYDDQFIETCAEWVIPYIGDLVRVRHLHSLDDITGNRGLTSIGGATLSERADVANTIGYRRRKGTAGLLEPVARDVTGWPTRAVEFFRLIAATQFMSHVRLTNHAVDVRHRHQLERLDTPFDTVPHTVDVRRIEDGRGRYNIPNIGIFLWRLRAYSVTASPAYPVGDDGRRYMVHPLGINTPLFARARTEDEFVDLSIPSQPYNLPAPITRNLLQQYRDELYGPGNSLVVTVDGQDVPADRIAVADLSTEEGGEWRQGPSRAVAIDPELGRIAFSPLTQAPGNVTVTYHYGFSADIGGGEYARDLSLEIDQPVIPDERQTLIEVRGGTGIQAALDRLTHGGTVRVMDSARYEETLRIDAGDRPFIELQAADGARPTLVLAGDLEIIGSEGAAVALNGFLIEGGAIRAGGALERLRLEHCTIVPGLRLRRDGTPQHATEPSLLVNASAAKVEMEYCISGAIRSVSTATIRIRGSIVDATATGPSAYAGADGVEAGGDLHIENSTVLGVVHARVLQLASNTIFASHSIRHAGSVHVERRQTGCVRYSYVPPGSLTPQRYHCQPQRGADPRLTAPRFTSVRYGTPGYCQLSERCPIEIREGADDESEIGAFHDLYGPQRTTNLRVRLDEYLRFGLEAGIFYST